MDFSRMWILDGATGTELMKRGYDGKGLSELWVLEHPNVMKELQSSYIEAGSDIIYTPTFSLNGVKLKTAGYTGSVRDINMRLAEISLNTAKEKALVAGDLAPTGTFTRKRGEKSQKLIDAYAEQAQALEEAGVDLFVIETMMSLSDAVSAVSAVKEISDKPVLCSCTCDQNGKMLDGTDIAQAMEVMENMGVDAFGLNCSQGPKEMLEHIKRLNETAKLPLIAKPNAGMPVVKEGKTFYDCTPEIFISYAKEMPKYGVKLMGGCCGTDADYIKAIYKAR